MLAHSSFFKLLIEGHLCAGNKSALNFWRTNHRLSASDKLAVDSLILLVFGLSFSPKERERVCLANCFQSKISEFVSSKLSKCLYIHNYMHLITSCCA